MMTFGLKKSWFRDLDLCELLCFHNCTGLIILYTTLVEGRLSLRTLAKFQPRAGEGNRGRCSCTYTK